MKRLLAFAAILLVLVSGGLFLAAPPILSSDTVKAQIAAQISDWTGRAVAFEGDASLSFFPSPTFTVSHVSLAGGDGAPFVTMDALRGELRLLPLLSGRVAADAFELVRPRFQAGSWPVAGADAAGPAPADGADRAAEDGATEFGRFVVTDGTVSYDDGDGAPVTIDQVNMTLTWPTAAEAALATGTFRWRGETIEANGSLGAPLDLIRRGSSPLRVAATSSHVRVAFDGTARHIDGLQVDGETRLSTPSLRQAIDWIGHDMGSGAALGSASLTAQASWVGSTMTFADTKLDLDGNRAVGVLSIKLQPDRPKLQGTLAFETLDLSAYVEAARAWAGDADIAADTPLRLPLLTAFDADLRLSAGQVLLSGARLGRAAAAAALTAGQLTLDLGDAQLYGGHIQGTVHAGMDEGLLTGSLQARLRDIPTRVAMVDFFGISALDGTAGGAIAVQTAGRTWPELVGGLSGNSKMTIRDSTLSGVDLGQLRAALLDTDGRPSMPSDRATAFDRIEADLVIEDGRIHTTRLTASAAAYLVSIDARASLSSPVISGRGTLVVRQPEGSETSRQIRVPFMIGGSWSGPILSPDLDRMLRGSRDEADLPPAVANSDEPYDAFILQ